MIAPTNNGITQGKHGTYNAVDYSSSPDANIYAPEDGTIVSYANNGNCGNNLQMNGANGRHGFCHLERATVSAGQAVKKGQVIGVMGYTGYTIPAGPGGRHLHWVLNKNGVYVYPPSFVNEVRGATAPGGNSMFQNDAEVKEAYLFLRGNEGTPAERAGWIGQSKQRFFQVGRAEADATRKQLADVKTALANEKAKPPKEVIKIVEKIVEKPVGGGLTPEESAAIKETNSIVKAIKDLLGRVFK